MAHTSTTLSQPLRSRTALVTGASRGIGRAIARQLASAGANVAIGYLKSASEAEELAVQLHSFGVDAIAVGGDASNVDDVNRMIGIAVNRLGPIDILVNNAGAVHRPADWSSQTLLQINRSLGENLTSAILCIKTVAPGMVDRRWGRIVNLSSTYGAAGSAAALAYSAAKAGIDSITRAMARELGKHGVTVNAVAPANVATDMTRAAGPEFLAWAIATTPLGRLGSPEDISEAVLFLVLSSFITGHVLVVDGGHSLGAY